MQHAARSSVGKVAGAARGRPARQLCPTGDRTLSCVCQDTLDGDNWGRATGLMGRGSVGFTLCRAQEAPQEQMSTVLR